MNMFASRSSLLLQLRYWVAALALACSFGVFAQQAPGGLQAPSTVQAAPPANYASAPTAAAPAGRSLVAGRDYLVLAKPMPVPADRLEVTYFFWYNSPTTAKIDPLMRDWAANKASPLVKFRALPAVLENSWGYGARIYFALQELGKEAQIGPKLTQALAQDIVNYNSPKSLSDWMRDQGVSLKDLNAAVNDPKVIAQTSWMPSLMKRYGVDRVPTVVIDGQFLFVAAANEKPEEFMSRVSFAVEALVQRKLQQIAKQRKLTKTES